MCDILKRKLSLSIFCYYNCNLQKFLLYHIIICWYYVYSFLCTKGCITTRFFSFTIWMKLLVHKTSNTCINFIIINVVESWIKTLRVTSNTHMVQYVKLWRKLFEWLTYRRHYKWMRFEVLFWKMWFCVQQIWCTYFS